MHSSALLKGKKTRTIHREPVEIDSHSHACPRCRGFVIREDFCDTKDSCSPLWIVGVRCTNCGFIGDELVQFHRTMAPTDTSFPQPRRRRGSQRMNPIRKGTMQIEGEEKLKGQYKPHY